MLQGIEVQNYRGIREGLVSGFGSINLFVGPNGSGKSSLLEAVFFGAHEHKEYFNFHGFRQPGAHPLIALRHNEDEFPAIDIWYRKDQTTPVRIVYSFSSGKYELKLDSTLAIQSKFPDDIRSYFSRMRLLDTRLLLDRAIEQRNWDQLLDTRGDRELLSVMNQVYGLSLESLTYSVRSQKLKALFSHKDYALNIDDLGAGIRIAFRMFMAILLSRRSAVLAEEFDCYQHITSFPLFVKALRRLTQSTHCQLFLATHSVDTVRAFVEQSILEGPDVIVFQTALRPDGTFETSRFTANEAETLISGGFDLRKTS